MSGISEANGPEAIRGLGVKGVLQEFFRQTVERWPERVAVEVPPGRGHPERAFTTYAQLDLASEVLAGRLQPWVTGECVVGILLPRDSSALYCAQLAVLKAGAAYTCVDPAFPAERIRTILHDAEVVALLTHASSSFGAEETGLAAELIIQVAPAEGMAIESGRGGSVLNGAGLAMRPGFPAWLTPASLAYIIYTSGTTGTPKGVMIEHRSVANLVAADLEEFRLSPDDRVGQSSSAAYDSSVEETWLAWAAGATLVVMDEGTARLGPDLIPWLREERITVFCPPPTLLRATGCADPQKALPDLRLLYVGGEALPRDIAEAWAPGRSLVNGYGPTECTVTCLRGRIEAGAPVTIGRAVPGIHAWILDESLEEVANGDQGQLCLGGMGLARGYWKRPGLTDEKFIDHPRFGRLYLTGDLVQRSAGGEFVCHGRVDAQVKIRGYRVELDEIEARLVGCGGVRAAACRLEHTNHHATLVGFVVPEDAARPPSSAALRDELATVLPGYMVPAHFALIEQIPTTVGGKLNRAALPRFDPGEGRSSESGVAPRSPLEGRLEAAVRGVLQSREPVSVFGDFFTDLGGDSLTAAQLVTRLRGEPGTEWVTVRDVYEARTVAGLAARAPVASAASSPGRPDPTGRAPGRPFLTTLGQVLWLVVFLMTGSAAGYLVCFELTPWLVNSLGLVRFVLLAPLLSFVALTLYTPLAVAFAVGVKRLLIGRYRPLRAPVWGGFHLRNWVVTATMRLVPWKALQGTVFQQVVLRALGARIGRRVHIHRGVDLLRGGWDLLSIGNDVTISQDAALRLVELSQGEIVVGPVTLEDGATLDVRAGVDGHTRVGPGACLAPLSSLPSGERIPGGEIWDGIPARRAGRAPAVEPVKSGDLVPWQHGLILILARLGVGLWLLLPAELLGVGFCLGSGFDQSGLGGMLGQPAANGRAWLAVLGLVVVSVPLTLAWALVGLRLLGPVPVGTMSRWSLDYVRVWLKTGVVEAAGHWLSGTLFWPVWLRAAGMKMGRGCEISTIVDVIPEHIGIGSETFFADGIYLGGPRIQAGRVLLASTRLGRNTFLGNHVVIPAGQDLPDDLLLGVCTVAQEQDMARGTSWFGHPPFELPRREVVEMDRRLTHDPSAVRVANRVFWEALRFFLPVVPLTVFAGWIRGLMALADGSTWTKTLCLYAPAATLGAAAVLCLWVLGLKWMLLGRVRPGQHALWSCWCSRWDFLYVAWGQQARRFLEMLEGTLLLPCYLRAMGMSLGKRVVLGPGFAQVVDPDMIVIEDGATVCAMFQAHTFEDRVLKIDRIRVGRHATLGGAVVALYGAEIGERTHVASHSVIMKRERLLPGLSYESSPTRTRPGSGGRQD